MIVHVNDDAGEIAWAAWCHIPHSPASVERVLDRLGLAAHVSTEQVLASLSATAKGADGHRGSADVGRRR